MIGLKTEKWAPHLNEVGVPILIAADAIRHVDAQVEALIKQRGEMRKALRAKIARQWSQEEIATAKARAREARVGARLSRAITT